MGCGKKFQLWEIILVVQGTLLWKGPVGPPEARRSLKLVQKLFRIERENKFINKGRHNQEKNNLTLNN